MDELLEKNLPANFNLKTEYLEHVNIQLPGYSKANTFFCDAVLKFASPTALCCSFQLEGKFPPDKKRLDQFMKYFLTELLNTINHTKICVNEYTSDQLLIWMALANGTSQILVGNYSEKSKHTVTQIEILKQFIPEIKI